MCSIVAVKRFGFHKKPWGSESTYNATTVPTVPPICLVSYSARASRDALVQLP
jgi:hypothetical protein